MDSSASGHCFVLHGYNASGNVYVNWGWKGAYDGYYDIDLLNPDDLKFSEGQDMVFVVPGEASEPDDDTFEVKVTAIGDGKVFMAYNSIYEMVNNSTQTVIVNKGDSLALTVYPGSGQVISSLVINGTDMTSEISGITFAYYELINITEDKNVVISFEEKRLHVEIASEGGGYVKFKSIEVRDNTKGLDVDYHYSETLYFTPDEGYKVGSAFLNGKDITWWANNYGLYYLIGIEEDIDVSAAFVPINDDNSVDKYKLTYIVDSEVYKTYELEKGATITPEPAPTKSGYAFSGWSEIPATMPAYDVEVYGSFISEAGINDYLQTATSDYSMSQNGDYVKKSINFYLKNNHRHAITLTKVVVKHPDTGEVMTSSENTNVLGVLGGGEMKSLNVTIYQDIDPIYEWYYTYNGENILKSSAVPVTEPKFAKDALDYCISNDVARIIKVYNDDNLPIIPQTVIWGGKNYTVSAISSDAFADCSGLQTIVNFNVNLVPSQWSTTATIYTENTPSGSRFKPIVSWKENSVEYSGTRQSPSWTNNIAALGFTATAENLPSHTDVGEYSDDVSFKFTFDDEEYTVTSNATLKITKAPLTIAAGTYTKAIGEENPEFTLTYTGFKNSETSNVLTTKPVVSCEATVDSPEGEYPVTVSGANAKNYEISYVPGKLIVTDRPSYYLVYYVDDVEYKRYSVEEGSTITPEPAPEKEGCTFSGWSEIPATMPAHDVTVTGTFTANQYTLTYMVDGEAYKALTLEYGAAITPEPAPEKEGHAFSGWSEIPATMPAHDVTVTGSFTVKQYILTYIVDGAEYKTFELDYGTPITPEPEPEKEGYIFSGWSEIPETMPARTVVVTGSFTVDSGILAVWMEQGRVLGIYTPGGKKLDHPQKGLNIVLFTDGTVQKMVVK